MSVDLPTLMGQLERWATNQFGEGVTVAGLEPMPGHAGLSFGFRVLDATGVCLDDLVMRMPPKGVRRQGNTDVLRQVPLLQALGAAGVPVAEVRHWSDDESWFDVPFFMVGKLPGETYIVRKPDPRFAAWGLGHDEVFGQAVEALARVHTFDWRARLASWEAPRDLVDEIHYWDPILAKAAEPEWIGLGERTRDLLLANVPAAPSRWRVPRRLPDQQHPVRRRRSGRRARLGDQRHRRSAARPRLAADDERPGQLVPTTAPCAVSRLRRTGRAVRSGVGPIA